MTFQRLGGITAAIALVTITVACDGGDATPPREPRVAAATPVERTVTRALTSDADTSVRVEPTLPSNVTYADAEAVYRSGRYADAAEIFGVYVAAHPDNGWGHYMLGLSFWKAGDRDSAVAALEHAIELDSTNVKARTNIARVLLEHGRADDALVQVEAARMYGGPSAPVLRVLGNALSDLGRGEEALDAYREALVLDPEDAWSMNNYGLQLIRLGRFDEALPPLARAVELRQSSALFQNNLGVALERTGDLAGAAASYEAALAADDAHERARISLTRVQQVMTGDETSRTDLGALAVAFISEVASWRLPSTAEVGVR